MGDFNRDGKIYLAVANTGSNNVSILSGEGDGTFQIVNFSLDFAPSSAAMGDFNGDGDSELAVAGSTNLSVFLGNDGGGLTEKRGKPRRLELNEILCVAPYNMQVRRLQEALPSDARTGSVDKVLRPRKLRAFLCPGGTVDNSPTFSTLGGEFRIA